MNLDSQDRDLLLQMDQHQYTIPGTPSDRSRLDRLTELGYASREGQPFNSAVGDQPPPRYRLTPEGRKRLRQPGG